MVALAMSASALLAACSAGPPSPVPGTPAPPAATPANEAPSAGATTISKVAIAYDLAGRGGGGFNDLAYDGAKTGRRRARRGAQGDHRQARPTPTRTARSASGCSPRRATTRSSASASRTPGPLAKVAPQYPDTWFGIVDDGDRRGPERRRASCSPRSRARSWWASPRRSPRRPARSASSAPCRSRSSRSSKRVSPPAPGPRTPTITVQTAYLSQPPDYAGFNDPAKGKEAALGHVRRGGRRGVRGGRRLGDGRHRGREGAGPRGRSAWTPTSTGPPIRRP